MDVIKTLNIYESASTRVQAGIVWNTSLGNKITDSKGKDISTSQPPRLSLMRVQFHQPRTVRYKI